MSEIMKLKTTEWGFEERVFCNECDEMISGNDPCFVGEEPVKGECYIAAIKCYSCKTYIDVCLDFENKFVICYDD